MPPLYKTLLQTLTWSRVVALHMSGGGGASAVQLNQTFRVSPSVSYILYFLSLASLVPKIG